MVLPVILGGAAVAARFLIPKVIAPIGKLFFGSIPRAAITILSTGVAVASPKFAKSIIRAPITIFEKGKVIGEKIEELPKEKTEKKLPIGLIGGAILGTVAGIAVIPKIIEKIPKIKPKAIAAEKPITPETQIIQTEPVEAPVATIGKPAGVSVNVNVTQRQTRRIKNIAILQ